MTTPLARMTAAFPQTCLWNDSANPVELAQSISFGGVGATCNPVIALQAIKADLPRWLPRIAQLAAEMPTATESQIGWKVVEEVSIDAARLLEPIFDQHRGKNGRLSMQTDPRFHRDAKALADQAEYFSTLAPNIIVKIPATEIGVQAIEEATYRGVSVNVTVSFTVAQAVETGEAIERGLNRRRAEGKPVDDMGPVVTIMVGRLDDWMKDCHKRERLAIDPGLCEWAGVAAFKHAYEIFQQRGLTARLLSAAFRNTMHLAEFVGGDVVVSPPFAWQQLINDNDMELPERMSVPVEARVVDTLYEAIPDFRRAYDVDGMRPAEFESFGATAKTLRQFLDADAQLDALVRDQLVPAP